MSRKLWVVHRFDGSGLERGPVLVSTEKCRFIVEFLQEIKLQFSVSLAPFETSELSVGKSDTDTTIIKNTDTMGSLGEARGHFNTPVIVKLYWDVSNHQVIVINCEELTKNPFAYAVDFSEGLPDRELIKRAEKFPEFKK
jgi:hypothetical protein